jgi:hypothetical protein
MVSELAIINVHHETFVGHHILDVSENLILRAKNENVRVRFNFNDVEVIVAPNDMPEQVFQRWSAVFRRRILNLKNE